MDRKSWGRRMKGIERSKHKPTEKSLKTENEGFRETDRKRDTQTDDEEVEES